MSGAKEWQGMLLIVVKTSFDGRVLNFLIFVGKIFTFMKKIVTLGLVMNKACNDIFDVESGNRLFCF